ncbi:MAG: VWA domain-containing protein [Bacteroidales bacterium]|nr:VWA domain-containing protein [Bacteroidales bacterium]
MKDCRFRLVVLFALFLVMVPGQAQQRKKERVVAQPVVAEQKTHLLLILDCSKSMWDTWQSDAKIKITQQVLLRFLDSIAGQRNIDVALRVFGHLNDESYGTRLEVPFEDNNLYKLQAKIKTLVPSGNCDASSALTNSLDDFAQMGSERNIILIITDGIDDCAGDICEVARHVQMSGVIVQTFILGIGSRDGFKQDLSCAGRFLFLSSEEMYSAALFDVLRQADEMSRVSLRVTDADGLPYETSFPVAFYDSQTGIARYTTLYSSSTDAIPDTFLIDPLVSYDVTFFTKPETHFLRQTFPPNQVSILKARIDQGQLSIRLDGTKTTWATPVYEVLVRQQGRAEVLSRQQTGDKMSYLAGIYDIEVLSRPSVILQGIEIRGDASTDLSLPTPGMLTLSKSKTAMVGSIFAMKDGKLFWVCDVNTGDSGERILLMPGDYQLVARPRQSNAYSAVRTLRFSMASAELRHLTL